MKRQKCLVWITTIAVPTLLCTAALTELLDTGTAGRWRGHLFALRLAICCIGAVGVIFLGLAYHRLAEVITSIADRLDAGPMGGVDKAPKDLVKAITSHLESRQQSVRQLEADMKDLQLHSRLSDRQKRHTEAIIYSLRDAVVVIDEADRLLVANEAASCLFGFDLEAARHQPVSEVMKGQYKDFVQLLQRSRQSGLEGTRRELEFTGPESMHTYDAIVACVHEDGRVCGVVAVLHDITREKEISQMKNDFVSHVSHELKTPLASITAYSEMLVDGEADDEQTRKEFYGVIQSQAQRLNRLIEDILNISRIESGLIKVQREPVSLTILIEQQMQMIKGFAEDKNITVSGQEPIVFDQVYADTDMISQVVVNLLSNAVKYTPPGGSVTVSTEVDEAESIARVTVTDTGVGIPADEVDHVFDKFYRVGANKKQAKGTGLGLNLVKQIVEKVHNGRVFVTSEVGVGSTFGFELPLAAAEMAKTT